jgi:hypothetical protein
MFFASASRCASLSLVSVISVVKLFNSVKARVITPTRTDRVMMGVAYEISEISESSSGWIRPGHATFSSSLPRDI